MFNSGVLYICFAYWINNKRFRLPKILHSMDISFSINNWWNVTINKIYLALAVIQQRLSSNIYFNCSIITILINWRIYYSVLILRAFIINLLPPHIYKFNGLILSQEYL
jgi:hypothetical protein